MIISFVVLSCGGLNSKIGRNHKKTDTLLEKLTDKYKNAFSISSTNANYSTVWFYHNGNIIVHLLVNGKIRKTDKYISTENNWIKLAEDNYDWKEFRECMVLDGDLLEYRIVTKDTIITQKLPVEIPCFLEVEFEKEFYNELSKDIKELDLELY